MARQASYRRSGVLGRVLTLLLLSLFGIALSADVKPDPPFFSLSRPFARPTPESAPGIAGEESAVAARVIDGDTIELADGRRVRYIGIDTPETGEADRGCFGKEATEENRRLVEGKTVRLRRDVSDTDRYGRLLRYVYAEGVFVNQALVAGGFAVVSTYPPDVAYVSDFVSAQEDARMRGAGIWSQCPER